MGATRNSTAKCEGKTYRYNEGEGGGERARGEGGVRGSQWYMKGMEDCTGYGGPCRAWMTAVAGSVTSFPTVVTIFKHVCKGSAPSSGRVELTSTFGATDEWAQNQSRFRV